MDFLTREQVAQAFVESLGNQGVPVVEEIIDNFSDTVLMIVCKGFSEAFEVPLDLEWTKKRTIADLKAYLIEWNIPFDTDVDFQGAEEVEWESELEYTLYTARAPVNGEIDTRSFLHYEPSTKLYIYSVQSKCHNHSNVSVNRTEVESNIKAETARFFAN